MSRENVDLVRSIYSAWEAGDFALAEWADPEIEYVQADVYDARIQLSGEGLPSQGSDGYALLDDQSLSTSQFQEQTSFKRAMEGELSNTIEAIDSVETAVVHLAMPTKQVFSDEQDELWSTVLQRKGGPFRVLAAMPPDPSRN